MSLFYELLLKLTYFFCIRTMQNEATNVEILTYLLYFSIFLFYLFISPFL